LKKVKRCKLRAKKPYLAIAENFPNLRDTHPSTGGPVGLQTDMTKIDPLHGIL
jgi:hypothetical protein